VRFALRPFHFQIKNWLYTCQARRQDLAAVKAKNKKEGKNPEGVGTFLKYSIGCMQQPEVQT